MDETLMMLKDIADGAVRPRLTYAEFQATKDFVGLDGIRAIAVFLVLSIHYGGTGWEWLSGWLGVQLFFVLSGFLITTLMLREVAAKGRVSLPSFYARRFFRIAPVYLVLLVIFGLQSYMIGGQYWTDFQSSLPYYLTFMNEYRVGQWGPTWTLGIEWKFYMVWPLLAFALPMRGRMRILVALSSAAVVAAAWRIPGLNAVHYGVMLIGAGLAIALNTSRGFSLLRPLMAPAGVALATAAMVIAQTYSTGIQARFGAGSLVVVYGLAAAMFLTAALTDSPLRRTLAHPTLAFIGRRSYSIYLVQVMAYQAIKGVFLASTLSTLTLAMTAAMAIVFADCLYRWVEQPMISIGRAFIQSSQSRGASFAQG